MSAVARINDEARPPRHSPRRGGGRGAAAIVLAVLALGLAACGATRPARAPAPTHGFGRLAGYVWSGQVSSVHGAWLVPVIAPGSPAGHGSTWIGAQVAGPSDRSPFIQVGTTEDRWRSSSGASSLERAFWSATSLGFHPHFLWRVRAGDQIRATLVLLPAGWRVEIADLATGRRSEFTTQADARGSFAVAEWLQEDPTANDGSRLPYPQMGPIRFVALSVNGDPPRYRDVASQWMSLHGFDLAPTPLRPAGFSIAPTSLSTAGSLYLSLVGAADAAITRFDAQAATWRANTPLGAIIATSNRLASALGRFAGHLAAAQWPGPAQRAIAGLVADLYAETVVLRGAATAGPHPSAWTDRYSSAALTTAGQSRTVRRRLHLPELSGSA